MKIAVAFLSIFMASGLTMVTVYNTLVDAKSWGASVPGSIQTARDYYRDVDPRRFYLAAGPPTVVLGLLTMIAFWQDSVSLRLYFGASAVCYILIVVLTIAYFVPRDLVLFREPLHDHVDKVRLAVGQWSRMNWVRTLLGCAGVSCAVRGLDLFYRLANR